MALCVPARVFVDGLAMRVEVKSRFKWSGIYTGVTSGWDGLGKLERCGLLSDVFLSVRNKKRNGKYAKFHTNIPTHTYSYTHKHTYIHIHIHIHSRTYVYITPYARTVINTHIYTHTYRYTRVYMYARLRIHIPT